jgi:hypothetical protein
MKQGTVVVVAREALYPRQLLIGVAPIWRKKSLRLLTIDPKCRWETFMDKLRYKDITRISFNDDYTRAVLAVAGPVPPQGQQQANTSAGNTG